MLWWRREASPLWSTCCLLMSPNSILAAPSSCMILRSVKTRMLLPNGWVPPRKPSLPWWQPSSHPETRKTEIRAVRVTNSQGWSAKGEGMPGKPFSKPRACRSVQGCGPTPGGPMLITDRVRTWVAPERRRSTSHGIYQLFLVCTKILVLCEKYNYVPERIRIKLLLVNTKLWLLCFVSANKTYTIVSANALRSFLDARKWSGVTW